MTFENFKKIIDLMILHTEKMNRSYKNNIDLYDFMDTNNEVIDLLWTELLTSEGIDWLDWFLYEKNYLDDGIGRKDLKAYDNGKEICKDLKGLYKYLTKYNYFKTN
jgi:hypothetical protein